MNVNELLQRNSLRITSRTTIYKLIQQGTIKASKVDGKYDIHEPVKAILLSTELIAQIMGCSDRWIRKMCAGKRLQAKKYGRQWRVDIKEAYSFINKRTGA